MEDFEENIVPVGIDSENGGEVTFSALTVPIADRKFFLEDRLTGIFTDMETGTYTITLPAQTYGTGRFYIHSGKATGIEDPYAGGYDQLDIKIWAFDHNLNIEGELSSDAIATVYDLLGRTLVEKRLSGDQLNILPMPSSIRGIYMVRVVDGKAAATRKVGF
jgi:hypothetical protein